MRLACAVVVGLALSACPGPEGAADGGGGAGGDAGGTDAGATVPLDAWCDALAAATCAHAIRCGDAIDGADCARVNAGPRLAQASARVDCLGLGVRAALAEGKADYDGRSAARCLAAVAATTPCATVFQMDDDACRALVVGRVAEGGGCVDSAECRPGLYCDATAATCPGVCRPRTPAGAPTDEPASCAVRSFFSRGDDGGVCTSPVPAGGDCAPRPGSIAVTLCEGDTICREVSDGGRACLPRLTPGAPCGLSVVEACAAGAECRFTGLDEGVCVAFAGSGEACGEDAGTSCARGLACIDGQCGPLRVRGESCEGDDDCVGGLYCDGVGCQPLRQAGQSCNTVPFENDCLPGLFCDVVTAVCTPRRSVGEACAQGDDCDAERGAMCGAPPDDGGTSLCVAMQCLP